MSTNGSFIPAAVPECPYAPRMTRAAALALRAAAGLLENCVVVITDGGAIGPAATVTEIELNPVSPTAFGQTARVFTTYDNDAWAGIYDIDLGAGTLTELRDNRGNVAKDVDAGGDTIATQFPWGNTSWRDCYAEDAVLTAANAQVGNITNCRFVGSTVNFTGKTAGAWTDTEVTGATVTTGANMVATRSVITGATVSNAGAGTFDLSDTTIADAATTVTVTAAATGSKTMQAGTVVSGRFRMNITGQNTLFISGATFTGLGAGASEAELGGTATISISDTRVLPAFGAFPALDLQGAGVVNLAKGDMSESRITVAAGATASVNASTFTFRRTTGIIVAATAAGSLGMSQGCFLAGGGIVHAGSGVMSMNACQGNVTLISAAGSGRGATLTGITGQQMTVTQNGTGSAAVDSVTQSEGIGMTNINLNSTSGATPAQTFTRLSMTSGAVLNVVDPAGAQPVDNSVIETQSTVNLQAGGSFSRCRFAGEATVNTGAFAHIATTVEYQGVTTFTGANVNRLRNPGFSDVI